MKYFKPNEFSEDIKYAAPSLLFSLNFLRGFIQAPIFPSPAPGALARFNGSSKSQHYVGDEDHPIRLSTAIDVFIDLPPFEAFVKIIKSKAFNRIGVYTDVSFHGKHHVMFHIDLKPRELMWYRDIDYVYSTHKDFYPNLYKRLCQ